MSTLRTTNLQHPSAASPNMVLASDGKTTFGGAVVGAGMDLISKTDFSAVSSVSVNGCFTSAYENYRIVATITTGTVNEADVKLRFRTSGTDSSTGYYYGGWVSTSANSTGTSYQSNGTETAIAQTSTVSNEANYGTADIYRPALAVQTGYHISTAGNTSVAYLRTLSGGHWVSTAYDGFTLYPTSGTMTGTVRVYGYRNS